MKAVDAGVARWHAISPPKSRPRGKGIVTATPTQMAVFAVSEAALQNAIVQYAEARRWFVYHTHDSRRSQAGFPDLILARVLQSGATQMVVAELKAEDGRVDPEQAKWLDVFAARPDTPTFVWRPRDWPNTIEGILR